MKQISCHKCESLSLFLSVYEKFHSQCVIVSEAVLCPQGFGICDSCTLQWQVMPSLTCWMQLTVMVSLH